MAYIKNQILQNNALEAWAMAVRYCDYILEGKVTLEYRKHFVSVLHNAVELFVKQLMLNNTDYRVTQLKKGCNPDGQPARDFYNSKDLNAYFSSLDEQTMKKFFSIEFNKIVDITNELFSEYYDQNGDTSVKSALSLLNRMRNCEMHFFIDKNTFLLEKEFQQLHNFMIEFYNRNLLRVDRLLNALKIRLFKVVKCDKKQENVGNSYFIPALFIYHTPTLCIHIN